MQENKYAESLLKGRMAETLVEGMLMKSGNTVYRFGYEAILQNLVQIDTAFDRYSEVGERVRAIPDFVVLDAKGEPKLVEVKFRWNPTAPLHANTIDLLERVEKYWDAEMIFVNCIEKPYFRIARPPYFKTVSQPERGLVLEPLTSVAEWHIDPAVYEEYEHLVEKYLTPTLKKEGE